MEVVNPRSSLLSNYEVLNLLRELESDHLAKTKTALRIKKEEEASGKPVTGATTIEDEICENLRTVEVEAIQYLTGDFQPIAAQSDAGITKLVQNLEPYGFTKAEKLQIVNLAPTEPVELYVIVEELEDRLGERMEEVLSHVRASLDPDAVVAVSSTQPSGGVAENQPTSNSATEAEATIEVYGEETWMQDTNYIEWDDSGEGAGIEGDLEMDDE
ncbi:hypothetical protein NEOLEDRAFT_1154264 [Neolentinus lepideus HHB14362 ss-1]|uniref:DNA-directed RNA polymerase III subunit RPC9 n=1 Tax=Neolentinus lepideus HHB14362 ss-1 TaxID=1314782 RepID=A0A165UUQ9_9AGAM|nr:hypothetical protein NEOLEDRAFT_1154264 [Neolentinus lepideus HHB14362 ss-1]